MNELLKLIIISTGYTDFWETYYLYLQDISNVYPEYEDNRLYAFGKFINSNETVQYDDQENGTLKCHRCANTKLDTTRPV
jgi:hypothetical protein